MRTGGEGKTLEIYGRVWYDVTSGATVRYDVTSGDVTSGREKHLKPKGECGMTSLPVP